MHIILHIVIFYMQLVAHLVPYLISGVAVYLYFLHKEWMEYYAAVDSYAEMFGLTREEAMKQITSDPL